jgi:hypothetical protein
MTLVVANQYKLPRLKINQRNSPQLGKFLQYWEKGNVHLVESNELKAIHQEIHAVILDAYSQGWKIILIDAANCFNPHQLDALATKRDLNTHDALRSIDLARPFQTLQTISLIEKARKMLLEENDEPRLVVVTGLSTCFIDPLANEKKADEQKNIALLQQAATVLQRVAVDGNVVIITDQIHEGRKSLISFSAKIHLQFIKVNNLLSVGNLIAHPYKSNRKIQTLQQGNKRELDNQHSIDEFF